MKYLLLITLFFGQFFNALAQDDSEVNLVKLQQESKSASLKFKQQLSAIEYDNDFEKSTSISFRVDTFLVEDFLLRRLEYAESTKDMKEAFNQAEAEYEKLIDKYFAILYNKVNATDKQAVRSNHESWIAYEIAEIALMRVLYKEDYTGGGTIQSINYAAELMHLKKERAIAYYEKLLGILM
jgi:hypothetical protein